MHIRSRACREHRPRQDHPPLYMVMSCVHLRAVRCASQRNIYYTTYATRFFLLQKTILQNVIHARAILTNLARDQQNDNDDDDGVHGYARCPSGRPGWRAQHARVHTQNDIKSDTHFVDFMQFCVCAYYAYETVDSNESLCAYEERPMKYA